MRIDVAQTDIQLGEKKENLKKAVSIIERSEAELIIFPEVFTTGFDYENLKKQGEPLDGETVKKLLEASEGKIIAGSIVEKDKNRIYNTLVLVGDGKLLGSYRKIHLFRKENDYFSEGNQVKVIDTVYGKIGLSTCYDLRFPELYRKLMDKGAVLCLLCANFPAQRITHWRSLTTARALENQFFIAGCNRVGRDTINKYSGNSMIVNPWGEIIAQGGTEEEILNCEINLNEVEKIRKEFPILDDMKKL